MAFRPPSNLHVVSLKPTSVTLAWTRARAGGASMQYDIVWKKLGSLFRSQVSVESQLTGTVTGLQPDTKYDVYVQATSSMGTSVSNIIQVTTPSQGVAP